MKPDIAMERGYGVVNDKSRERYASSEDEMAFNQSQVLEAAGIDSLNTDSSMPFVNITKNKNVHTQPWS